jgi:hypothetical protein
MSVRPPRPTQYEEVQRLKQQLEATNRKTDYAHLCGYASIVIPMSLIIVLDNSCISLYAELRQYRDIICVSCKEKVLLAASSTTRPLQQFAISSSVNTLRSLSAGHTNITAAHSDTKQPLHPSVTGGELSSPLALSPDDHHLMAPVEYNPEIGRSLDLSVVSILAVPAGLTGVDSSRNGQYFAVALGSEETHIYDITTMSKR